jgi:hypothetical protein
MFDAASSDTVAAIDCPGVIARILAPKMGCGRPGILALRSV